MAQSKQVVVTDQTIGEFLNGVKGHLTTYATDKGGMKDFLASAALLISESGQLQDCLKTPAGKNSLYHAMKYAANTGLSLNPQEGKAAIMAYGGKVQYQVMKNGLMELAERSGKVKAISCDTVRENDEFDIEKTFNGDTYRFRPARKSRGEIDGFFAAVLLKDGSCYVKYMTKEEVETHRDRYSAMYKSAPDKSPWKKSFEGMGQKTVIKALFRNVSISGDLDRAIGTDDAEEFHPDSSPDPIPQAREVEAEIETVEAEVMPEPAQPATDGEPDLF